MRKVTIIIVLIALGLQVQTTKLGRQIKESVCTNKDGVMMAMPGSCSGFFFCIDGNAIASSCGNFYHFNARLGICDHPKRALCRNSPPALKHEVETDEEAEEMCNTLNTVNYIFGKSKSCTQFYVCYNKQALKRVCPPQKHFNLKTKLCQDIQIAQCVYAKPVELTTTITRQLPADICSRSKQDAMIPHPWDCNLFVFCIKSKPLVMTCPKDLHFSIEKQRCEWPSLAKCASNNYK